MKNRQMFRFPTSVVFIWSTLRSFRDKNLFAGAMNVYYLFCFGQGIL